MATLFSKNRVSYLFPKQLTNYKKRIKFLYNVSYINFWDDWEDCEWYMYIYKPDMEKLFQNYLKTKCVPYFSPMVVSFVKDTDEFVESNKNSLFVVSEDLLNNWQQQQRKQ